MPEKIRDPGTFRLPFVLLSRNPDSDDFGGRPETFEGDTVVWAAPIERRSAAVDGEAGPVVTGRLTVLLRAGHAVEPGMLMVREGRAWRVLSAFDPDLTGRYLTVELVAEENP